MVIPDITVESRTYSENTARGCAVRCMKIPVPERKVTVLCYEFEHWVVLELPSFQIPSRDWKEVRRTLEELYGKNAVWEKVRKLGHSSLSSLSSNGLRGE